MIPFAKIPIILKLIIDYFGPERNLEHPHLLLKNEEFQRFIFKVNWRKILVSFQEIFETWFYEINNDLRFCSIRSVIVGEYALVVENFTHGCLLEDVPDYTHGRVMWHDRKYKGIIERI